MTSRQLPQKAWRIIENEGIISFTRKSIKWAIVNSKITYLSTVLKLMLSGRTYHDVKWLLENKSDRQDALVSSASWGTYHGPTSRESHQARYEFAAEKLQEFHSSEQIDVLDVASGTGYGSKIFENKCNTSLNYHGCEIDSPTIRYSNKYYPSEYIQASVEALPFKGDVFKGIVSLETMEHIPDIDKYLGELRRVSTEDSKLIISTPCDENLDFENELAKKEYPHRHTFDLEEIKSLLKKHFPDGDLEIYIQTKQSINESKDMSTMFEKVSNSDIDDGDYFLIRISR